MCAQTRGSICHINRVERDLGLHLSCLFVSDDDLTIIVGKPEIHTVSNIAAALVLRVYASMRVCVSGAFHIGRVHSWPERKVHFSRCSRCRETMSASHDGLGSLVLPNFFCADRCAEARHSACVYISRALTWPTAVRCTFLSHLTRTKLHTISPEFFFTCLRTAQVNSKLTRNEVMAGGNEFESCLV
jgi:hypothetical protein